MKDTIWWCLLRVGGQAERAGAARREGGDKGERLGEWIIIITNIRIIIIMTAITIIIITSSSSSSSSSSIILTNAFAGQDFDMSLRDSADVFVYVRLCSCYLCCIFVI